MNTDSFLDYMKTEDMYKDIAKHFETRFDNSYYESERPLPKRKRKNVIGLIKHELVGKIKTEFDALRAKILIGKG